MSAARALGRQLAHERRRSSGAGGVHGAEEGQDALQDTEEKGEEPAEKRGKDEQGKALASGEAERCGAT